ncbi:DUF6703 family protein [Fodinibacter luteus]|uniref:DUF6703 family protein n=1 Tax=Fodinibacter luteus TaxID=552064 RepID=UPI0031E4EC8B
MRARLAGARPSDRTGQPGQPGQPVGWSTVSSLRESFERASLPALTWLSGLPRVVPFLFVLALVVAGLLVPGWGWVLIAVAVLLLAWIALLAWPRLSVAERLMRVAVVVMLAAIAITQAVPRG